jgi:hypothetical protein
VTWFFIIWLANGIPVQGGNFPSEEECLDWASWKIGVYYRQYDQFSLKYECFLNSEGQEPQK